MALQITEPNSNPKRGRTIIIATVIAIIVLALGVWAIVSAINSVSHRTSGGTIVASDTQPGSSQNSGSTQNSGTTTGSTTTGNNSASGATSPSSQYTPTQSGDTSGGQSAQNTQPAPSTPVEQVPSTGPEDLIPTALLIGVAVYLLTLSRGYAKEAASLSAII